MPSTLNRERALSTLRAQAFEKRVAQLRLWAQVGYSAIYVSFLRDLSSLAAGLIGRIVLPLFVVELVDPNLPALRHRLHDITELPGHLANTAGAGIGLPNCSRMKVAKPHEVANGPMSSFRLEIRAEDRETRYLCIPRAGQAH